MKAISLWQPWAQWVALNLKTIETRTHSRFKCLKGERIAIHAAKEWDPTAWDAAEEYLPVIQIVMTQRLRILDGEIVCTVKVVDARWAPNVDFVEREEWNQKALCEVAGKYLLFFDEIEPLKNPIPFRGRQGIFEVPDELISKSLTIGI